MDNVKLTVNVFFAKFISMQNIMGLLRQISILWLLSSGLTFCMILNEFDLSIGEVAGLSGVVVTILLLSSRSLFFSLLVTIIIGIAFGLANGLVTVKVRIPSFIVTLAMMSVALGFNYFLTRGRPVYGNFPVSFAFIGRGYLGGIPVPVIISLGVLIGGIIFMSKTTHGRYMYAIGGNIVAARHSGIKVNQYRVFGMTLSGLCAALGGIVLASRLGSGQPTAGSGYLLDAFAACFLGTATLKRGVANLPGTFIGVILIGMLSNGLTMNAVPYYYEYIIKGLVVIGAVSISSIRAGGPKISV